MKIYTITLNPAYDVHASSEQFIPFHENMATITSKDAGGKGINITRALNSVNVPNTAVIVLGRENCSDYKAALKDCCIDCIILEVEGRIRENLTLHHSDSNETRISFFGSKLENMILSDIESRLSIDQETIVTFTGRVPAGIDMQQIKSFLLRLKACGAMLVIDSKSFSIGDIYSIEPWLIKPNEEEISKYFGENINSLDLAKKKALEISGHGINNVMITLGEKGAVLVSNGELYTTVPPKIEAVSTIGAGDSTIAGFISAYVSGLKPSVCLKRAVSFGTAACLTAGTTPPKKEDIESIFSAI